MKIQEAITEVMRNVGAVGKKGVNKQQNFNFRGVDAVVNALSPEMAKVGLMVRPSNIMSLTHEPFSSKSGSSGVEVRVLVEYTFTGPEGDEMKVVVPAEAQDYGDKGTAKVMSVAFRTCLLQVFALPTDQPDPDESTYDRGEHRPQQRPQAPAQATDAQKAWLSEKVDMLDPDERDSLLEKWNGHGLPGIIKLTADQAGAARRLVLEAIERHNAAGAEQYTDTPMVLDEVPAAGREALDKLKEYSDTGKVGIPQPGFMGQGPNGERPWYEGAPT